MKYFTKEWYELSQKTSYHLGVEEEKRAGTFSEPYFQEQYSTKLAKWLHVQQEVAILMQQANGTTEPFDPIEATKHFQESLRTKLELLKKALPEAILERIADLRVFALDQATREVIQAVTHFCESNERSVRETIENYSKYYKEASKSMDDEIVRHFGFHDCTVLTFTKNERSLTLSLDNTAGFTDIDEVIFENVDVHQRDDGLVGAWWLYEEIYKSDDKYEFHVLLQSRGMGLIELIVSAEKVCFRRNGARSAP